MKKGKVSNQGKAKFLRQNTAILEKNGQHILAHTDLFRSKIEPKDEGIEEELRNEELEETYDFDSKIEQDIESDNHIYPTPPLGQDVTQGQFLSEV